MDALVGFLPPAHRSLSHYRTGHNVKVWFGEERREHYEAQLVSPRALKAAGRKARAAALEIGFHAEHPDAGRNDAAIAALVEREDDWRPVLGAAPEAGRFIGAKSPWRRLSEIWDDAGVIEPEAAIEAAERLACYITAFEPIRSGSGRRR